MRHFFTSCFCLAIAILCIGILTAPDFVAAAPITENPNSQFTCEERTDTLHDTSAPLQSLPVAAAIQAPPSIIFLPPYKFTSPQPSNFRTVDPARQSFLPSESMPAPVLSFDGISRTSAADNLPKPDTNGDVGSNHYVQSVNGTLDFYNKNGNHLYGPITDRTLFTGFGGWAALLWTIAAI